MRRKSKKSFLLLPVLILGGCTLAATSLMDFNPLDYFGSPVNMREKNYAAADYLISRAGGFVDQEDTIQALPLQDIQEPRIITLFGKQVAEQVGERLIQLGYNVDLREVWTEVNAVYAPKPTPGIANPDYLLTGSYLRRSSSLDITLRIQDAVTGADRAIFEFNVPRTGQVRRNSTPEPAVYKTRPASAPNN